MDLIAKKYILLVNDEPVELWLKNGKVKRAKFMDKEVALNLNEDTIKQIRDYPTRVVNAKNFSDNLDFTKNISKMMSQKLELAMLKNDKKTLSRFARSKLVPENMKENFIESINSPRGLRRLLVKAVNNTNAIFQNLAKRIDMYFNKVKDKVANQKLDKYLEEYQLKEFNKAPPLQYLDVSKRVDAKVMYLAEDFIKKENILNLDENNISDKVKINDFLTQTAKHGINATDSKIALSQILKENMNQKELDTNLLNSENLYIQKEAYKNSTLDAYAYIIQEIDPNMDKSEKLNLLMKNDMYRAASPDQKEAYEKKYIYPQESIQDRAIETKEIAKALDEPQSKIETTRDRVPTLKFNSQEIKKEIDTKWRELQAINREQKAQNRDFMNISAVKFAGVSEKSLNNWRDLALKDSKTDSKTIDKFVNATLRNAKELTKVGILKEATPGEYKFVDNYAKQSLYKNLDKTVEQIATANQGKSVQIETTPKIELQERVQQLSSEKSFEALIGTNGEIDSQKLHEYAKKLETLATQLHSQEKANIVTREDLQKADRASQNQKLVGAENVRG